MDTDRFVPLLDEALRQVRITAALAEAAFDSEANHRHARERRGVPVVHRCQRTSLGLRQRVARLLSLRGLQHLRLTHNAPIHWRKRRKLEERFGDGVTFELLWPSMRMRR